MPFTRYPPPIYKLPPKLWPGIQSFLDQKSLTALSLVSKRFRELNGPKVFEKVLFRNVQRPLSRTLQHLRFRRADDSLVDVRDFMKAATVWVYRSSADYEDSLPIQILESIPAMKNLRVLYLNVYGLTRKQMRTFNEFLASADRWRISHLHVDGNDQLACHAIERCSPGILEGIFLCSGFSSQYKMVAKHHKQLKRLRLSIDWEDRKPNAGISPIDTVTLGRITKDFKDLEWLAIKGWNWGFGDATSFDIAFGESMRALNELKNLRHLAFNLKKDSIPISHAERRPTTLQMHIWYTRLIHHISNASPKLRQICILVSDTRYEHYEGTRSKDGDAMRVLFCQFGSWKNLPRRFPYDVVDWDGPF